MSLANTGRGLALTIPSDGDSSPYSFGTSLGLGWVRNGDGTYSDINNAPYAAGWTGWSALWLGECANVFNHEIGHSMTLLHFTDGAAASWGIADEYPQEGTNLATHPWGFDTTRRQFRTWYRVDSGGVVTDENGPVGKRDAMNGGEAANSLTCFPQYTAYHASKIQDWAENSPTLMEHEGEPGVWRWNANTREYESEDVDPAFEEPTAVGVPVVTLTGTLGNDDGACQTYPANFWPSGNAFSLPDPTDPSLPANYEGARWFLEITYAEGSSDRALIARGAMDDTTSLALFSVNIESERAPTSVSLYRADTAYPELDPEEAELIHTRLIEAPTSPMDPIVRVGRGFIANGDLLLEQRCSAGIDCDDRRKESTWRIASPPLFLEDSQGASPDAEQCLEEGGVVALELPATNEEGSLETVVVHAQRVMASSEGSVAVPMNDTTAWFGSPDTEQSLRVWMPYEANQDLPAGHYRGSGDLTVLGSLDGSPFSTTGLAVNLTVHDPIEVDLSSEYVSPGVGLSDSSVYYLVEDPSMGPNWALWWGGAGPTVLRVPVVNESTGDGATLVLDAWKEACGSRWELNSGQASDWNCDHAVVLRASETGNEGLEAGHSYRSPGSSPLVVSAHRWHQPGAGEVLQTLALEILYAPTE